MTLSGLVVIRHFVPSLLDCVNDLDGGVALDALGFAEVMRPVSTSCADHMGAAWARIHTWDGSKWGFTSDWYEADMSVIKPMVKSAAARYATEKKITPRTPEQCQS